MKEAVDQNNPDIEKYGGLNGYNIKRIVELKEISSFFYELEHIATGAQHIHISNNDRENTFSVAFKTIPSDSTGVAHILEHTVLCGSNKFPVRDPFFSMLKRSLNTFMNAFTASDWTMYPFSTQNRKDYYNLMDVYLDASFYPNLDMLSFKQEGHRLEIEGDLKNIDSAKLVYKGVVYNEMKGAMSSPDQVMARSLLNAMYPLTTYRFNSGGDPAAIPDLSYDQLKAFHKRYYHPSNAFFYTYGNLSLKDHLFFINDKILKNFKRINPGSDVPSHPRWEKPKKASYPYPFGKNKDPLKKCQVSVAWLTSDIKDTFDVLALTLLDRILLGNSASPIRKALIDSGLGTAICDAAGFESDNRDTMFSCGLKDVKKSDALKIETIILDVLTELSEKGIEKNMVESAIHQIEFRRKEVMNQPYPYGINLLFFFSGSWFHGGDPVRSFQFDTDLENIRDELSKGPFFESRIKKYFLDNTHRLLFTLVPDQLMEQKENDRTAKMLDQIKSEMTPADLEKIDNDAAALKKLQETEEDLAGLPTLAIGDVPPSIEIIKETSLYKNELIPAAYYNRPTSGIFYFSLLAGAGDLQKMQIPLIPFFCYAFSRMGTSMRDYSDMAQRIDLFTGGISLSSHSRINFKNNGACFPFTAFTGKCLARNLDKMFDIIKEFLRRFDFSDLVRLKNLLLEFRAGIESMIIQNGHRLAILLASRNFSKSCALKEIWHGVHQLQTIKNITDDLTDDKLKNYSDQLTNIGKNLFTRNNIKMSLIGEDEILSAASSFAASIMQDDLAEGGCNGFVPPEIEPENELSMEGWSTSSAVSFVAGTFKTVRMGHKDAPALSVISKMLRSMYLHREIREKGGAYGGFAIYNSEDGLFSFASYRDPHIVSTLKVYDKAASFIKSGKYSEDDIKEAILQVCSEIDKPDPPGPSAEKAFYRKIISLSDETRIHFKEQLLALTRAKIINAAEKYFDESKTKHAVAVISSEDKLKAANKKIGKDLMKIYKI